MKRLVVASAALFVATACGYDSIVPPSKPETSHPSGDLVRDVAIASMNAWYLTSTDIDPYMMLMTTADAHTTNTCWGRFENLEPRTEYNNTTAGTCIGIDPWNNNYGTLSAANDVLKALAAGVEISDGAETRKFAALARFAQAASLTNLALMFDSAFVVDESTNLALGVPALRGWRDVNAAAMERWNLLIADLQGRADVYESSVLPTTAFPLTSANLLKLAHSFAALTLRLGPRTPAELNAQSQSWWQRVLDHANAGITADFTVQGDGNDWYSLIAGYGSDGGWMRIDHRKINRMDAVGGEAGAVPMRYSGTSDIRPPGNPSTNDQRLGDGGSMRDYVYRGHVSGDPARGVYMQSAYTLGRYAHHSRESATAWSTAVPYILRAEIELLAAEAMIRTGANRAAVAGLINRSRVNRGGLSPLTGAESDAALLAAIDYERDVELSATNGFELFYARTSPVASPLAINPSGGRLQPGTIRHLPVPGSVLDELGKPIYTYGGPSRPDMIVIAPNGERLPLRKPVAPSRRRSAARGLF